MIYGLATLLINWTIFFFYLKDEKFYPAKAKFYWTLIVILIPFGWFIFLAWGRKKYVKRLSN